MKRQPIGAPPKESDGPADKRFRIMQLDCSRFVIPSLSSPNVVKPNRLICGIHFLPVSSAAGFPKYNS